MHEPDCVGRSEHMTGAVKTLSGKENLWGRKDQVDP